MKQIQTSHMIPALCAITLLGLSEYAGSFVSSPYAVPKHAEKCELIESFELSDAVQVMAEPDESTLLFGTALYAEDWDQSCQGALSEAYTENKGDIVYYYEYMDDIIEMDDMLEMADIIEIFDIPVEDYAFSIKEY